MGATTFMVAKTFMRVLAISVYDNLGILTLSCCCWQHGWKWCLLRSSDSWRVVGIFHEDVTLVVEVFGTMGGILAAQFVVTFKIAIG
jgi:hypothetical protein